MSVQVTTYTDDEAPSRERLPEARAVCDGCGRKGPPVECRPAERRREHDPEALALAVLVAAFHRVTVFLRQGKARAEHRCAACVKASDLT